MVRPAPITDPLARETALTGLRAQSRIALSVRLQDGRTVRDSVAEAGSLRVRFPHVDGATEAILVNTAGGVARGGRLVYAETVRLDGAIAGKLAAPAVAGGRVAIATVLIVPGNEATVAAVRDLGDQFVGEVGASSWNGLAVARLCAADGATLRH